MTSYRELLPLGEDRTEYRKLTSDFVSTAEFEGEEILKVEREGLRMLSAQAFADIAHFLRPGHLQQLRDILEDPEASANDRFVALDLLKNANIAAGGILPMCQDTGTAIVMGKKGRNVRTAGGDEAALSDGAAATYAERNLRYSNVAPLSMFEEVNTGTNLPAQIEIYAADGDSYGFLFVAKGGGSANKSFLYQQTPAVLNEERLLPFLDEKIRSLGTAACPPYHLAVVIGGTSAEFNLKTVKLASTRYLDGLPTEGNEYGQGFRDLELNERFSNSPETRESAPSSAASISVTMSGWCGCRGTARACRSVSASRARRIGRRWARSRGTAYSWSGSKPTPPASCRRSNRPIWPARS